MDYANLAQHFNTAPEATESANASLSLPTDGLPERFVAFCKHVAERRNVPAEVVLLAAMTATGAVCGAYVKIHLAGFTNNAALQVLIIAPSGAGKSQPLADVMKPLEAIDSELIDDYRRNVETWTTTNAKCSNPTPRPKRTQLLPRGETDAALRAFCIDNERGGLYFGDEIRSFFKSLGTKYNLNGCAKMIEAFDGRGVKIDVAGDVLKQSSESFLGLLGGLQPALLPRTLSNEHFDSGMMHRFVPFSFEQCESYEVPQDLDLTQVEWWNSIVRSLRSIGNIKWKFEPSPEASKVYAELYGRFRRSYKSRAEACADFEEYRRTAHSKTLIHVHKFILIAHLLHIATEFPTYPHSHPLVQPETIRWAFSTADFLLNEKMKLYSAAVGIKVVKTSTDADVVRQIGAMMSRKNRQLNQSALAEVLGIDRANISRYLATGGEVCTV